MADVTPNLAPPSPSPRTVTGWAILFMVLLRIAIGWHFFYEGVWKLRQDDWRATGYLVASSGPFRPIFHTMVEDVDGLERLTLENMHARMDRRRDLAVKHYNLSKEQAAFFTSFVERKKHGIADGNNISAVFDDPAFRAQLAEYRSKVARGEPADRDALLARFTPVFRDLDEGVRLICTEQQKQAAGNPPPMPSVVPEGVPAPDDLAWLTGTAAEKAEAKRWEGTGDGLSPPQLREKEKEYLCSLVDAHYNTLKSYYKLDENQHQSSRGWRYRDQKKVGGARDRNSVDAVWADPDFQAQLTDYRHLLAEIKARESTIAMAYDTERLAQDYAKKSRMRSALLARFEAPLNDVDPAKIETFSEKMGLEAGFPQGFALSEAQMKVGPLPPEKSQTFLIDWANMIGLMAVGACLTLGLFTRLAAIGGIGLLTLYYLAMPPLPGLPESPSAEGHYLIVNKNLIEAIALMMIAATRVGRWGGLDAYISALWRRIRGTGNGPGPVSGSLPPGGPEWFPWKPSGSQEERDGTGPAPRRPE